MVRVFTTTILWVLLFCCAALCQQQLTVATPPSRVANILAKAAPPLREKTAVPLRISTQIAGLEPEKDLYAIVKSADKLGYTVLLAATPDCQGQHACSFGDLMGAVHPFKEIGEYGLEGRSGTFVQLQNRKKGYFTIVTR